MLYHWSMKLYSSKGLMNTTITASEIYHLQQTWENCTPRASTSRLGVHIWSLIPPLLAHVSEPVSFVTEEADRLREPCCQMSVWRAARAERREPEEVIVTAGRLGSSGRALYRIYPGATLLLYLAKFSLC